MKSFSVNLFYNPLGTCTKMLGKMKPQKRIDQLEYLSKVNNNSGNK